MAESPSFVSSLVGVLGLIVLIGTFWQQLAPSCLANVVYPGSNRHPEPTATMSDMHFSSVSDIVVSVRFYGESMCPFCRKFVTEAWPPVWADEGIRPHLDYDMIAWGNAYFATKECGEGPYSPDERACWYKKCISTSGSPVTNTTKVLRSNAADKDDCFTGPAVYQHGRKEAIVDIYETCIKKDYGLDDAVTFTYCAEGKIMDNDHLDAEQIMRVCSVSLDNVDSDKVQDCYKKRGRDLEIANAKITPAHPGVPFVLVEGEALDDPLDVKKAICDRLKARGMSDGDFPEGCRDTR